MIVGIVRTYVVSERLEAAQAAKLGVQLIYGVNMFGIFEALRLGAAFDLDQAQLIEIFSHSVGDSWVARNWDHVRDTMPPPSTEIEDPTPWA